MPRLQLQPSIMHFVSASSQNLKIGYVGSSNKLDGLSALTMVIRLKINAAVNGGIYFSAPYDGTQAMVAIKNTNNTNQTIRINFRAGGTAVNYDVSNFTYALSTVYTMAIRYNGSLLEFWVDGHKYDSRAATGAFGTSDDTKSWGVIYGGNSNGTADMDAIFARAWNTALTDPQLYQAMLGTYTTGAILNLPFMEGAGTPVETANGATVTLSGFPTWISYQARTAVS